MKPARGRTVYCLYCFEINKEIVGYSGKDSFIVEDFSDNRLFDSLEYFYDDYGKQWFTSLTKAKAQLRKDYREINPGKPVPRIVTLCEDATWGFED